MQSDHTNITATPGVSAAPVLAVVIHRQLSSGGVRRHIYRSISAAEKAIERAERNGLRAVAEFVRLEPVAQPSPQELSALERGDERA